MYRTKRNTTRSGPIYLKLRSLIDWLAGLARTRKKLKRKNIVRLYVRFESAQVHNMKKYRTESRNVQRARLGQVCPDLNNLKNELCQKEAKEQRAMKIAARAERRKAAKECRSKAAYKAAFDKDLDDVFKMETSKRRRDCWKVVSYKAAKERQ